jgi:hypothetical protein
MAVTQSHYRFGINELIESTHGWHAAEDTDPSPELSVDTTFLLRFTLQCNATGQSNVDPEFQYRKNGGAWTNITPSSSNVKAVLPVCWLNGAHTSKRLSGTGTFDASNLGCTSDGTAGGSAMDIAANGNNETECGLQLVGADLVGGDLIEFRLTRDGGVLLNTYAVTPSLSVPYEGTVGVTLDAATLAATGTVEGAAEIVGTLSVTLGAATLAGTGAVDVQAVSSVTLGAVTLPGTGTVEVQAVLSATLAALQAAGTGAVAAQGTLGTALDAATLAATGTVDIQGTLSTTLDAATLAATSGGGIQGLASITLAALGLSATGTVAGTGISGTLNATLAPCGLAAVGSVPVQGTAALTLGTLVVVGTNAVIEVVEIARTVALARRVARAVPVVEYVGTGVAVSRIMRRTGEVG